MSRLWLIAARRSLRLEELRAADIDEATDAETAVLLAARSAPVTVATSMSQLLAAEADAGRLSEHRLRLIDANISELIDLFGGAERIVRTPVPLAYAHHIKSFLTLFCLTAPLALLGGMGALTPVAATVVAFGLYGIDEIGVEIEDPFGEDANDLPMAEIFDELAEILHELDPA